MAYATMMESSPVDLVQIRPGSRLAVLKIVPQVGLRCHCSSPAADYLQERQNESLDIFNCKGQGTYQCGWGDCSTNFTDQNPFTIILRDDQKSATTSLPAKESNTLAVGLGIGLSLGTCLLISLWLLFRQHHRLKKAQSATSRKSIEKTSSDGQWPHESVPFSISQGDFPIPQQPAHISPIRHEAQHRALSAIDGLPRLPKIPDQRGPHELRDESNELHELDSYNPGLNGTREFV